MAQVLKDPFVHFLVLGLGLFALFALVSDDALTDARIIEVDDEALRGFVQNRSQASATGAAARLDTLSDAARERLIDDYVREEALYRQALALGMDKTDYVIKRRLVQSIEFITEDLANSVPAASGADLEEHFEANRERYAIEPSVTFTHVFFDAARHSAKRARELVTTKLTALNRAQVPFAQAPAHGDRFLYLVNYVEREPAFIASHFGEPMAQALFDLTPDERTWVGPFESPYGQHVVLLIRNVEGRDPQFAEVAARVRDDVETAASLALKNQAIQAIVNTYEVKRRFP